MWLKGPNTGVVVIRDMWPSLKRTFIFHRDRIAIVWVFFLPYLFNCWLANVVQTPQSNKKQWAAPRDLATWADSAGMPMAYIFFCKRCVWGLYLVVTWWDTPVWQTTKRMHQAKKTKLLRTEMSTSFFWGSEWRELEFGAEPSEVCEWSSQTKQVQQVQD